MTPNDEQALGELMQAVGAEVARTDDTLAYQDESLLQWLAADLRAGLTEEECARDERDADAFAARVRMRLTVHRTEERLPRRELRYREPAIVATVSQAVELASAVGCVAVVDQAAAAGAGRELWDDPCESWLELPSDISPGRYVAIHVDGDSMTPVLASGDLILIKLDAKPTVDDLVVARHPDNGFVVKRLAAITARRMQLASLNPEYPSYFMKRERSSILGVVIARFSRAS